MIKSTKIPEMEQAVDVIFDMSADAILRERVRLRQKALLDEASALHGAREEGIEIGMEKGMEKGINSIVEKMRKRGITEEEIQNILNS